MPFDQNQEGLSGRGIPVVVARQLEGSEAPVRMRSIGQASPFSPSAGQIDTGTAIDLLEVLQSALPPIKAASQRGEDVPCISDWQTADELRRRLEVFIATATRNAMFTISDDEARAVEAVIMCAEGFPGQGAAKSMFDSKLVVAVAVVGIAGILLLS